MKDEFGKYYEAKEPGRRERAYAWATAIGLQDVDGLKPSKYLIKTAKRNIEGEISAAEARKLVDEYYETKINHDVPADAVEYELSCMIEKSLAYDFDRERKFKYKGLSDDAFVEHFAAFISGLWQIHPFREGNTRTAALFAIKYLKSMRYEVTNDLFAEKSWYFRNAPVRANYSNRQLDVEKTSLPLEEFFKVLVFQEEMELKNRYLRIGAADTKALIGGDPHLSAARIAEKIGLKQRQVQRIIASLKKKAGLKRRGARKNGEWYFEEP